MNGMLQVYQLGKLNDWTRCLRLLFRDVKKQKSCWKLKFLWRPAQFYFTAFAISSTYAAKERTPRNFISQEYEAG